MGQITAGMFGNPSIALNGNTLSFPYRQAEAILYYLFVHKTVNKNILADLIWEDKCGESKMKSNLRNAFYIIRKSLGRDFLQKESNDMISINSSAALTLDTDLFMENPDNLALYKGDFLDGFYLKNNAAFNEWAAKTRQFYRSHYLKKLHDAIVLHYEAGNFDLCERFCRRQLQINEFDETAYKYLMQVYVARKEYTQALHTYNRLESLLEQELFESPTKDIQELAHEIENSWNDEVNKILEGKKEIKFSEASSSVFYGRSVEMKKLQKTMETLSSGFPSLHLLISGEAGVGKTKLADQLFLTDAVSDNILKIRSRCYFAEEKYILKPWQKPARDLLCHLTEGNQTAQYPGLVHSIRALFPFMQEQDSVALDSDDISTLDYKSIQSVFVNALINFSISQPLIFFFDDIQWADEVSLSLMRDIMTSLFAYPDCRLLFIFASRNGLQGAARHFTEDMCSIQKLDILHLKPFDFQETAKLASCLMPNYAFTDDIKKQLYHDTEGNALFITEAVNTIRYNGTPVGITPHMKNIIQQRITSIPGEYRQILNLISIFFDGISYECLSILSKKDDFELVEILEFLLNQNLLKESLDQNNTFFSFTHQKIMEFVYEEMSWTKKRILHNKAGVFFESRLTGTTFDMGLYPNLIYHFEQSANQQKYLKYAVKYLYNYLNVTHEFFPVIEHNLTLFNLHMREETKEGLPDDLSSIEKLLYTVENRVNESSSAFFSEDNLSEEQLEILSDYLHMIGRHYIRICGYEKGLFYILKLKSLNADNPSRLQLTNLLQANRQLICVYINRYEPDKMREIVLESLGLLSTTNLSDEVAIWKRLEGLGDIMEGNLAEGIEHLQSAIETFTHSPAKDKHLYNMAAAYSWIGEAHRHLGDYQKALSFYDKALKIGNQNFLVSGVAVFYAYAGMAAFDGNFSELSEQYLLDSIRLYEKGNLMWGRSLPYSYYSLILLKKGLLQEAFQHLQTALCYAQKLESRYETGIIYRIYAQIKAGIYPIEGTEIIIQSELPLTLSDYKQKSTDLLKNTYSPIDLKYLQELNP